MVETREKSHMPWRRLLLDTIKESLGGLAVHKIEPKDDNC